MRRVKELIETLSCDYGCNFSRVIIAYFNGSDFLIGEVMQVERSASLAGQAIDLKNPIRFSILRQMRPEGMIETAVTMSLAFIDDEVVQIAPVAAQWATSLSSENQMKLAVNLIQYFEDKKMRSAVNAGLTLPPRVGTRG